MNEKFNSHIPSLDGIRAMAALMVMFFHFFQNLEGLTGTWQFLKVLSSFGQTGVSLFFVLSGFLISRILIKEKNSDNYFLNFYFRRSLRIFPLYYFYLILVFFIIPLINHTDIPLLSKQIYHWVYLQDFAITFNWDYTGPLHFWSLAVEEHFYLFFPILVYYLKPRQLVYGIFIIMLTSIIVRFILNKFNYEVFYFTFSRMDELGIGAILALLELKNKLVQKYAYRFLYLLVIVALPTLLLWVLFSKQANDAMQVIKFILIALVYFCIIGFVVSVSDTNKVKKFLDSKPLAYIGKISYGLYVYHGLCFHYFDNIYDGQNLFIKLIGSFALAIITASLSFYLFESYFLRFKNYFKEKS